uniref:TLC domain-containing protein n=1 Tax=Oryza meridionalis TaxID=40149 RepID=A0A0E0C879_9ORYZ
MTQTPNPAAAAPAVAVAVSEAGLPDAIAAALPPDPYEQLEVARKITAVAVAARASRLELEAARLRQKLADKDRLAAELADRAASLEQALRDSDARLRAALDDNAKLAKERDSLAHTSKKLARDLAKLETFKRHLMQSLGDDNPPIQETVDIRTCEQSVAKASSWKDGVAHSRHHHPVSSLADGSTEIESVNQEGRTTRVDGKEFFRQARNRLSYEQFAAFLANIKELNAHRQSREETLQKADEIFGSENKDLFMSFQSLLSRSLSSGVKVYQMMDLSTTSVVAAKAYKYRAESLVKDYLLADCYVSYTAVLGGILMCKMVYDITHLISSLYYKGYGSLTKIQKLEWNNRGMSTVHAMFITLMSVYLVFFSNLFSDELDGPVTVRSSNLSNFTLGVSLGYFIADLAMLSWAYPSLGGMEYVLHHLLSIISLVYAIYSEEGQLYTYMVLISETTTPGINLRWFLDTVGMKRSKAYLVNGVTMFVAWLVKQMRTFSCILIFAVPTILLVMNTVWFVKILRGLKKTLAKRQ